MKSIRVISPKGRIAALKWIGATAAILYVGSMFIFPWIAGRGEWTYVQAVWDRWQALNVGLLAFISSLIAFSISRCKAELQRKRDFLSAKAFLPAVFSSLIDYFKASATTLTYAWDAHEGGGTGIACPEPPKDYREVFGHCIRYADPDVGDRLAYILARLQVHDARLCDLVSELNGKAQYSPDRANIIAYLYELGELQALINQLFEFARGEEQFNSDPLGWLEFSNAYSNLKIRVENMHMNEQLDLEKFTRGVISRNRRGDT